jgi:peroxiredoxin Q/BCP
LPSKGADQQNQSEDGAADRNEAGPQHAPEPPAASRQRLLDGLAYELEHVLTRELNPSPEETIAYTIQWKRPPLLFAGAGSFAKQHDERMAMAATLKEGDRAPDFTLPTDGGGKFKLSARRGTPVVLYFYPKDDTSGCTKEAINFTEMKPDFDEMDTLIVGISPDDEDSHDKFKAKYGLGIILAADAEKKVASAYGVWVEKSMYGKKYMGVDRSTFLVDRNGMIARIWRNVKVPGHVDEVLESARLVAGTTG